MKNKTIAIIQARLTSTRFPNKVLQKINNQTLIKFLINRLKLSKKIDQVIVAIPNNKKNKLMKKYLKGIDFFQGNENNVLDRFYKTSKKFNATTIVRICGDCPFVDPKIIDKILTIYDKKKYDYVSNTIKPTFPDGLDVEVFSSKILEDAWKKAKSKYEKEHVTTYILKNKKLKKYNYEYKEDLSKIRLTLDEKIDLKQLKVIFKYLKNTKNFGIDDIFKLYKKNKNLFSINSSLTRNEGSYLNEGQKMWK